MTSSNFLDANVWLALIWEAHIHSARAYAWFEATQDDQFFFSRFTQLAVLRLLTTEKVMREDVRSMAAAWNLWDRITSDQRIDLLAEPDGIEVELRARSQLRTSSPRVWADAYMLAFSFLAGTRLVTFDRALSGRAVDVLVL
jgi:toxin-antitoxin system PIN domain toxin